MLTNEQKQHGPIKRITISDAAWYQTKPHERRELVRKLREMAARSNDEFYQRT